MKVYAAGPGETIGGGFSAEDREADNLRPGMLSVGSGRLERGVPERTKGGRVPLLETELEDVSAVRRRHCVEDAESGRGHRFDSSGRNVWRQRGVPVSRKLVAPCAHVNRPGAGVETPSP